MAALKDLLAYLLQTSPHAREFSTGRITQMLYLSDWKHALDRGRQITEMKWRFESFGPHTAEVVTEASRHPDIFRLVGTFPTASTPISQILCIDEQYVPSLSRTEREAADHVIRVTQDLGWQEFTKLVYSTYPLITYGDYEVMDLPVLAEQYKASAIFSKRTVPA